MFQPLLLNRLVAKLFARYSERTRVRRVRHFCRSVKVGRSSRVEIFRNLFSQIEAFDIVGPDVIAAKNPRYAGHLGGGCERGKCKNDSAVSGYAGSDRFTVDHLLYFARYARLGQLTSMAGFGCSELIASRK